MRRRQSSASWDEEQLWTTVCVRRADSQGDEQTVDSAVTISLPSVRFSFTHRRRMDPTSGVISRHQTFLLHFHRFCRSRFWSKHLLPVLSVQTPPTPSERSLPSTKSLVKSVSRSSALR